MLPYLLRTILHPVLWFFFILISAFCVLFFGDPELLHVITYGLCLSIWAYNLDTYHKVKELGQKRTLKENLVQEDLEKFYRTIYLDNVLKGKLDLRNRYKNTNYGSYAVKVYNTLVQEQMNKLDMNLEKRR